MIIFGLGFRLLKHDPLPTLDFSFVGAVPPRFFAVMDCLSVLHATFLPFHFLLGFCYISEGGAVKCIISLGTGREKAFEKDIKSVREELRFYEYVR
jgi:hypothetical protein